MIVIITFESSQSFVKYNSFEYVQQFDEEVIHLFS